MTWAYFLRALVVGDIYLSTVASHTLRINYDQRDSPKQSLCCRLDESNSWQSVFGNCGSRLELERQLAYYNNAKATFATLCLTSNY
jgi:hypothetical protein